MDEVKSKTARLKLRVVKPYVHYRDYYGCSYCLCYNSESGNPYDFEDPPEKITQFDRELIREDIWKEKEEEALRQRVREMREKMRKKEKEGEREDLEERKAMFLRALESLGGIKG